MYDIVKERKKKDFCDFMKWSRSKIIKEIMFYIFLFFMFSFLGYIIEVIVAFIQSGRFINRGTLFGPWLPIYGKGGVLIVLVCKFFKKKPSLVFLISLLLCGILEYFTACYLELVKNMSWWDYSHLPLNIAGKIWIPSLIFFGLLGLVVIYILEPKLRNLWQKLSKKPQIIFCVLFLSLYLIDYTYSFFHPNTGEGITTVATREIKSE